MCDFDLSQALDSSPECEETGSESGCFDMTDVQDEFFQLDEGLCMLVSRNRKTLLSVANLLLAANRMTRRVSRSELSDEELCSAILESLVTETVVPATEASSTGVRKIFQRMNSGNLCTLCDCSQKDIVRASGDLKLQAVTLQGGHGDKRVNFKLSRYISMCASADEGAAVLLSITNKLHMSCCMEDGKAVLKLEECREEDLKKISDDGDMDRFLFYKRTRGTSQTTFESVRCRGWFISTSHDAEHQPVEMCEADAARRVTCFKMN
ncbi:interleukin-1 beta [Etheostoma cragini]|uniref:interleukin-1 beta n=1 Tax=Etheostoma cragini TaxID=417921 RepID=UPI00155EE831|nr:interleukin-1 beta [Etheostoma cragini]